MMCCLSPRENKKHVNTIPRRSEENAGKISGSFCFMHFVVYWLLFAGPNVDVSNCAMRIGNSPLASSVLKCGVPNMLAFAFGFTLAS